MDLQITPERAKRLLLEIGGTRDPELTLHSQLGGGLEDREAYHLTNGQILVIYWMPIDEYENKPRAIMRPLPEILDACLHSSKKEMLELIEKVAEDISTGESRDWGPFNCRRGYFEPDFIEKIDFLINQLRLKLSVPDDALDFTMKSLETVEILLANVGECRGIEPDLFAPLVAYVGEIARREVKGWWIVQHVNDSWDPTWGPTRIFWDWEPQIGSQQGKPAEIAFEVYIGLNFHPPVLKMAAEYAIQRLSTY